MPRKSVRGFAIQGMLQQCLERGFDEIKTCIAPGNLMVFETIQRCQGQNRPRPAGLKETERMQPFSCSAKTTFFRRQSVRAGFSPKWVS
jgi:hypothetical protein